MTMDLHDVIVIGGGISGLTTAWHLKQAGVDVVLLEADQGVGGCTRSERRDGWLLEKGPFNVIVRDPAFEDLLEALSGEIRIVTASKSARKRYIYRNGRIHVVPTNPVALLTTPLLSFGARLRLIGGLFAGRRGGDREETIEQVAVRRFGREVSDTMISAVIAGIFAGDIRRLSLSACFPTIARIDREAGSLFAYGLKMAFGKKKGGRRKRRWRGLVSIDGGLGALTEALGKPLGENRLTCVRAEAVREVEGGYEITALDADGPSRMMRCHSLVIATPVSETARLLRPVLPEAASALDSVGSVSMVVLNLGFRRTDVGHALDGFGFLAPHHETEFPLMGVLWADSIFPHHAPADHRLLRVFFGGARDPDAINRSDQELLDRAQPELRRLLQVTGEPVLVDVCRYPAAIPQYNLGYRKKIDRLNTLIEARPNLHLVGNYLEGVSLNDCIRCGTNVAEKIIESTEDTSAPAKVPELATA